MKTFKSVFIIQSYVSYVCVCTVEQWFSTWRLVQIRAAWFDSAWPEVPVEQPHLLATCCGPVVTSDDNTCAITPAGSYIQDTSVKCYIYIAHTHKQAPALNLNSDKTLSVNSC